MFLTKKNSLYHYSYLLLLASYVIHFIEFTLFETRYIFIDIIYYLLIFSSLILHKKHNKFLFVVIFIAFYALIQPLADRRNFFFIIYTLYILRGCDFKFALTSTLVVSLMTCLFIFLCLYLGILTNNAKTYAAGLYADKIRYDFGFGNPNPAAMFFGGVCMLVMLIPRKKLSRFITIIATIPIILLVYKTTGSKTLILAYLLMLITMLLRPLFINRATIHIIRWMPLILLGVFFFVSINYSKKYAVLNVALSGRLSLYHKFLLPASTLDLLIGNAKLFLAQRTSADKVSVTLDNTYLTILMTVGFVGFLFVQFFYMKSVNYFFDTKNYLAICVLIYFLLYGITEVIWVSVIYFSNLVLWILISREKNRPLFR